MRATIDLLKVVNIDMHTLDLRKKATARHDVSWLVSWFVVVGVGIVALAHAAYADTVYSTQADCVASTAKAQGYTGNVHSSEAWELFANSCK